MKTEIKHLAGLILAAALCGCQSFTYYSQAIEGQIDIWSRQRDIEAVVSDPATDSVLRKRLEVALQARRFASDRLGLPDNGSYTRFANLDRNYVVWNVIATPPFSIEPVQSCFPVVGCVSYRGYYARADAQAWSVQQKRKGMDVYLGGVSAYSTLGWFEDPLLSTMLSRSDAAIAALIFHELAHQRVYAPGDTRFNESFATAVEVLGLQQWAAEQGNKETAVAYLQRMDSHREVVALLLDTRERLDTLYSANASEGESELEGLKQAEFDRLRRRYSELRQDGRTSGDFDRFFESELNNASLALFGEYYGWVGVFLSLHDQVGGDWTQFYQAVEDLAALAPEAREKRLGSPGS